MLEPESLNFNRLVLIERLFKSFQKLHNFLEVFFSQTEDGATNVFMRFNAIPSETIKNISKLKFK